MENFKDGYDFYTKDKRFSGILLHISSLPGDFGIGSFGKNAYNFVDFLKNSSQKFWQVLPLGPTGFGNSPYQSFSCFAGNPYFIDLEILKDKNLISEDELESSKILQNKTCVNYEKLYSTRFLTLKKASNRFDFENLEYKKFESENSFWLENYSLFMALKSYFNQKPWAKWPDDFKFRNESAIKNFKISKKTELDFHKFLQYEFFSEWNDLKNYANQNNIEIIGDIPIYVAEDSADIWAEPGKFQVNEDLSLKFVGGAPPDSFNSDGQLWGNPIYDFEKMKSENFSWWKKRFSHNFKIFDKIRIDHFRGFESYWKIPAKDSTAKNGWWEKGPGSEFFDEIIKVFGNKNFIAEDLGFLTDEVYEMLYRTGFPGMKVLQFAFDPNFESVYLPHNLNINSVIYTGTHDNDTILGWVQNIDEESFEFAKNYFNLTENEGYNWGLIRGAMTSVSKICILQAQDLLSLGSFARMNTPGTFEGNWRWRMEKDFDSKICDRLKYLTKISGRINS